MNDALPPLDQALIVRLQLPADSQDEGLSQVRQLFTQLPDPGSLSSGQLVAVPDQAAPLETKTSLLKRMLGRTPRRHIHRAARCTALLARGFVQVGASVDEKTGIDWAWGYAPSGLTHPGK